MFALSGGAVEGIFLRFLVLLRGIRRFDRRATDLAAGVLLRGNADSLD